MKFKKAANLGTALICGLTVLVVGQEASFSTIVVLVGFSGLNLFLGLWDYD